MHFKSLELFGFKSFAERTRLDFELGVTAVVGPNGCGKSNIADAIKWVLGEQSAKVLRGGAMQDVIFNGTDGKEPVSYAEVSLTLANHDRMLPIEYDEITVTRRLYRSGESEYLLNKTPVRLKDINELFMGTGIGTSAYSLIEQGRIDQILSSKPEERREVFEEASGITKYKAKKREAMRRLDDTEQNLVRINDIIQEVKRQINSIERQAKKAERYRERYEELKELELKISRIELEILNQKLSGSNDNLDEFRTKEAGLNSELQRLSMELSQSNRERSEIETRRMDFKSGIMEMDSGVSKSTDKLSMNRERIAELKKRRVDLESEIEKSQENVKSRQKEAASLREKLSVLENEDTKRAAVLSEKEKRLQETSKAITDNETTISTSKANVIDIASNEAKLRNQAAKISTTLTTHDARLKRLNTEKQTVQEEKNTLDAKLSDAKEEISSIEGEASFLKEEKDEISEAISDLTSRVEKLIEDSKEVHRALATNKSRLEVLEEARARYEGFSSGVKAIMGKAGEAEGQRAIDGVRDVLANLLSVNKGYEAAIESALQDYLQCVIVDTTEAAEKAVDFIKENSCGRTSFMHPGSFDIAAKVKEVNLNDEKVLGRAVDFVDADQGLKPVLKDLLKNIFIVKDLEDAKYVLKQNRSAKECAFVTLIGEIVRNGFISGGGAAKEGVTLINRDAQIKELLEAIAVLEKDSQRAEDERSKAEEKKSALENKLGDLNKNLNEKEILLANARSRSSNIEENIKGVMDEISLVNLEIEEVTTEMKMLREEEASVALALAQAEKDAQLNEQRIQTSEDLIVKFTKEKEQLLIEIAEQRTELGSLESKKEGLSNTLGILDSSLKDAEDSLESRKTEVKDSIAKVKELDAEIWDLEKNIETLSRNSVDKNTELGGVEEAYKEIMQKIERTEGVFRQSEKEINDLRSSLHEVDLKKAETNYSITSLRQRIKDVYKLDLDEVQIASDWQDIEQSQLKNEVEEKRAKLDSMGAVNLAAIEEQTELRDRYAFLTHQCDDLLKAKDALLKAIAKINKTTKDLFIETFKSIQVEFRNFFKLLFSGGDGELILLDESNVLESGIEIAARPPGKRLQNVSLLSGGEKALTAIALIFAIFKVKPSPFCVLDEIDAPLDESNVDRFSRSLEVFTKTSQFIIITHNKKTIDMADVMYGITMQQSGVSKVVSVKFHEAKKREPAAKK